jgi:peptidyl-prolyl cis-trans isomerase C
MRTRNDISRLTAIAILCSAAVSCGKDDSVVEIGGRAVSKAEFAAYLEHKHMSAADEKQLERSLDEYARRSALAQAIEEQKLLDMADIRIEVEELKKEILISRYFDKLLSDRVGEDAVRNYYDSHAADYEEQKVHAAHLLIRTHEGMTDDERAARLTRAKDAHAKLLAGGDFAKIAAEYSEDRVSGPKGGDVGWLKRGAVDPKFSEVAFQLKAGAVSEPFLSKFGYHIVKVLAEPTEVKRPFEAVAGDIRFMLRQQAKEAEMKRLASLVKVEKHTTTLQSLKTQASQTKQAKK